MFFDFFVRARKAAADFRTFFRLAPRDGALSGKNLF